MPDPVVVRPPAVVPGPVPAPDPNAVPQLHPRKIIVKYHDHAVLPTDPSGKGTNLAFPGWSDWVGTFPGLTNRRLFRRPAQVLDELVVKAQQVDPTYVPVNLRNYVVIFVPVGTPPASVMHLVLSHPAVARAHIQAPPTDPPTVTEDTESSSQVYLGPALEDHGLDARYAWTFSGGDGAGRVLVDIERGWKVDHPDLEDWAIAPDGPNVEDRKQHGTATLGVIAARDNVEGLVGITPNLARILCYSAGEDADYSVSEAVERAIEVMKFGDVMLVEEQVDIYDRFDAPLYYSAPAEAQDDTYQVIRLATALGITVVAAAGNGAIPLDAYQEEYGSFIFG